VVNWLNHRFVTGLGGRAVVHVQNPTIVDRRSEPQPDLMLLKPREDFYRTAHPTPEDALLGVEVAHTSLAHDRRRKLPLYARTGLSEVWIVNRRADAVGVSRGPSPQGYRDQFRCGRGEELAPSAFPDLRFSVDDILGSPPPDGQQRAREEARQPQGCVRGRRLCRVAETCSRLIATRSWRHDRR
jgi:Uma2 family endonuclease